MIIEKMERVHIVYVLTPNRKNFRAFNIGHNEAVVSAQDATWLSEEEAIAEMNRLKELNPQNKYRVMEKTVIRRIYQ